MQATMGARAGITRLKQRLTPYPPRLKATPMHNFGDEAQFMLRVARHGLPRNDISYTVGCCFRVVACLMQVLFALNERYMMNEKGAVATAACLPLMVTRLEERVAQIYATLTSNSASLAPALDMLDDIVADVLALTV